MNTPLSYKNHSASNWLRMYQMREHVAFCHEHGAEAVFYKLPELPKELLDRLDALKPEHLAPMGLVIGETHTDDGDGELLRAYDDAPYWVYMELKQQQFRRVAEFSGGAGYMHLYACSDKPEVLYLTESDGESGCWLGVRFGHYKHHPAE